MIILSYMALFLAVMCTSSVCSQQGEGFMVGVQINPVSGLPSEFPVAYFFILQGSITCGTYYYGYLMNAFCSNCFDLFQNILKIKMQRRYLRYANPSSCKFLFGLTCRVVGVPLNLLVKNLMFRVCLRLVKSLSHCFPSQMTVLKTSYFWTLHQILLSEQLSKGVMRS